jgi:hypothetical protein
MLDVGTIPRSITVILENDLVDSCQVLYPYKKSVMRSLHGITLHRQRSITLFALFLFKRSRKAQGPVQPLLRTPGTSAARAPSGGDWNGATPLEAAHGAASSRHQLGSRRQPRRRSQRPPRQARPLARDAANKGSSNCSFQAEAGI